MPSERVDITADVVKKACDLARDATDSKQINDWFDNRQHYLQLRQRGRKVTWFVRARGRSQKIGSAVRPRGEYDLGDFLKISEARDEAARVYAGIERPVEQIAEAPAGWTWKDVDQGYQAAIAKPRWINRRLKPPSEGTSDDVRLAFAKEPYEALHPKLLSELDRPTLNKARDQIASFRQREKCVAYFKAAMTWAADNKPDESGLTEDIDRWWERLTAGDPTPEQMIAIEGRRETLRIRKAALSVANVGEFLARHEAYCAGRTAEDKISPGVRWGLWWVCYTSNRRLSTVRLRRDGFLADDPLGEPGWGRAMWSPDEMKAKEEFWLPLPPLVRDVANGAMADWRQLVINESTPKPLTKWVFASTRRIGRKADNDDVGTHESSLNHHIARMREDGVLDQPFPYFSLHLVRTVMANFLDRYAGLSPLTSSLVLAHSLPEDAEQAARTTREYYLTHQHMAAKAAGMKAWSEALFEAYTRAGGKSAQPSEWPRKLKAKLTPEVAATLVTFKSRTS
ncbi:hypothetical protein IVB43_10330 [Bradyrhizobium sp. 48]|uniref:hypothetical protein n=1 Tax=Bradyrhizobium sp. 48 TaxID=2782676 RepID=UPI001FF82788|nr:hypothetical protein [Bradyrhizobium sp. 48]MCK1442786.1 hypothetical protein [Bradyrhizobium sp. 48]